MKPTNDSIGIFDPGLIRMKQNEVAISRGHNALEVAGKTHVMTIYSVNGTLVPVNQIVNNEDVGMELKGLKSVTAPSMRNAMKVENGDISLAQWDRHVKDETVLGNKHEGLQAAMHVMHKVLQEVHSPNHKHAPKNPSLN